MEATFLKIGTAIFKITMANIIFNGEKLKPFLLKSGTRQGCPLLFSFVSEVLAIAGKEVSS